MSEGGHYPWKIQKVVRARSADYGRLRDPLPAPPGGTAWQHNPKTREWKLVPAEAAAAAPAAAATAEAAPPSGGAAAGSADAAAADATDVTDATDASLNDDEWEVLSADHNSSTGNDNRAGSVRSLSSMEESSHLSIPHGSNKVARTRSGSASTIESLDNSNVNAKHRSSSGGGGGVPGAGALGVDYLEHVVLPTDTIQGVCLAYRLSPQRLRQANCFSGSSLSLAPKKLIIPLAGPGSGGGGGGGGARVPAPVRAQDTDSPEYKIRALQAELPDLSVSEARAYLELSDWVLGDAARSAREDGEWEREMGDPDALHPGQIRIRVRGGRVVQASGAGLAPAPAPPRRGAGAARSAAAPRAGARPSKAASAGGPPAVVTPKREPPRAVSREQIPDIATKSAKAHDLYAAAPQHDSYGLELKSLRQPLLSEGGAPS